jgi:RNA polymerase sigma factor for flagellar operon FliA
VRKNSHSSPEEQVVRDNLHLVRRAVAELSARMPRHAARDDLVSAGMAGLAQAARMFDPSRGVPFDRYAATRIRGAQIGRAHV